MTLVSMLVVAGRLLANKSSSPDFPITHLKIDYHTNKLSPEGQEIEVQVEKWKSACENLGHFLLTRKGLYETGIFTSFSCSFQGKRVLGPAKDSPWRLLILETANNAVLKLFLDTYSKETPLAVKKMRFKGLVSESFNDLATVQLFAYFFISKMPYGYTFKAADVVSREFISLSKNEASSLSSAFSFSGSKSQELEPPDTLVIYDLRFDPSAHKWRTHILSKGARLKNNRDDEKITYKLSPMINFEDHKLREHYFAHGYELKGELGDHIEDVIDKELPSITERAQKYFGHISSLALGLIKNTIARGYVGLRFAPQLLPGHVLMEKTKLFSLVAEVRGGPLEGIRFYYDMVPKARAIVNELPHSIEWSRLVLGFSFGLNLPKYINRIDVVPKLGIWSFDATLPITDPEGNSFTQSFKMKRQFSFGGEFGIEWLTPIIITRTWTALDQAVPLAKTKFTVKTQRIGIDFWYTDGPQIFSTFNTAFLAFSLLEWVTLNQSNIIITEEQKIETVSLVSGYIGGGVAISW